MPIAHWYLNGQTRAQHKCRIDYPLFLSNVVSVGNSGPMIGAPKYDLVTLSCGHKVQITGPKDMPENDDQFFCEPCASELNFLS